MNRPRTGIQLLAGAIALTSLTAACGLKPDATATLKTGAGAAAAAASNGIAPGVPGSTSTAPGAPGAPGSVPGGPAAGGPGGSVPGSTVAGGSNSGGTVSGSSGTPATGGACGVPHNGTTTGITASTLNIGLHAPLTGTGTPFPNSSFQAGAQTFWDQPGHTVCGRKVHVEFRDDTYTPSGATSVCNDMAGKDFIVVGGGGTDQIQACATAPKIQSLGVPYLSPGVTDNGLTGLSNYFALSLSYAQQGALVLQNAKQQGIANPSPSQVDSDNISGQKAVWAVVTANTKNFEGARNGIEQALNAAHIPYKDYKVDQNGDYKSAATQFGSQLAINGFKTIFVDAAPGYFVFMSGGYYGASSVNTANWVGPGVTYTEVTVAQYICTGSKNQISGHAWFLSPAPGLDHASSAFKQAYNNKYDDIEWALWGLSETLWNLLNKANANLTRQNFIASTEHTSLPAGSVYPPLDYAHHGGHFGGTGAWVQRVNCGETEPNQNQNGGWDTVGNTYLRQF